MSAVRIYWPAELSICRPDDAEVGVETADQPVVLSFPTRRASPHSSTFPGKLSLNSAQTPIDRARLLHENRCCGTCGRASVVPQEDLVLAATGNRMPVPGAGSIVGVDCARCGHHWEV